MPCSKAMSGITTTGATVIVGLDVAPPGILLWRAILHWLGGIGFIVMAVAILPMLRVGGMQLVRTESSDLSEKILPRAAQVASAIGLIYLGADGHLRDPLLRRRHDASSTPRRTPWPRSRPAATRRATPRSARSPAPPIEAVAIVFMILGSLPFVLYIQATNGQLRPLLTDAQVRWFMGITVVFVARDHRMARRSWSASRRSRPCAMRRSTSSR